MSRRQLLVSAFILWHLTAMVLGSIPSPADLSSPVTPAERGVEPVSAAVMPLLDALKAPAEAAHRHLVRFVRPFRRPFDAYLRAMGLEQRWAMFWSPPLTDEYLRVRYYVGPKAPTAARPEPTWAAAELVSPAHREDRVRLLQSFHDSYRDKATDVALGRFRTDLRAEVIRADTTTKELPDALAPLARYFARRFERERLGAGERILRVEVWAGTASNASLGGTTTRAQTVERFAQLSGYYAGPVVRRIGSLAYPPYHAQELEADIEWVLEYFEEP